MRRRSADLELRLLQPEPFDDQGDAYDKLK